jgi:hypothetical protein
MIYEVAYHHGHGEIADGHTIGAGVYTPVERYRVAVERSYIFIGGLVDEAAPRQFFG